MPDPSQELRTSCTTVETLSSDVPWTEQRIAAVLAPFLDVSDLLAALRGQAAAEACAYFALGDRSSGAAIATMSRAYATTISRSSSDGGEVVAWLAWLERYIRDAPMLTPMRLRLKEVVALPNEALSLVATIATSVVRADWWAELIRDGQEPHIDGLRYVFAPDPLMDVFTPEGKYSVFFKEQRVTLPYPSQLYELYLRERLVERSHAVVLRAYCGRNDLREALHVLRMRVSIERAMLATITANLVEPLVQANTAPTAYPWYGRTSCTNSQRVLMR